jgi:hypothetical protein
MSFLSVSYGPVALSNFLQAVQSPSTQVFPEHIISLAWEVIWKIQHLTEPQVSDFVAVLGWHNEDISTYAKSSTIIRVKQTALKCAYLLDDTETILDLSATLFLSWDEQVLLDSLNYLTRKGDELKARTYLMQVWSEWYPKIIKLEPIQDTKFPLLSSLSNYAFLFWHRELAHEIIQILEGSDVEITPEILFKYKKNVSSPEDFVFLTTEFQSFFVTGKSNIMSPELLTSFRDFANYQIDYFKKFDVIEPTMLAFLEKNTREIWYDFNSKNGQYYFVSELLILLALFFEDAKRAEYIIEWLKSQPQARQIVADVMRNLALSEEDADEDISSDEIIHLSLLGNLARTFQGIEYIELQEKIMELMHEVSPEQSKEMAAAMRAWNMNKGMRLSNDPVLAWLYLSIVQEANNTISPIRRTHFFRTVMEGGEVPRNEFVPIIFVYFTMEFFLFYGKVPFVDDSILDDIITHWKLTPLQRRAINHFYHKQILSLKTQNNETTWTRNSIHTTN